MKCFEYILLIWFGLAITINTYGQEETFILDEREAIDVSQEQIDVLKPYFQIESIDDLLEGAREWRSFTPETLSAPRDPYWLRIKVKNESIKTLNWVFYVGKNDLIDVYTVTEGNILKETTGYLVKKSEKTLNQGGGYYVPISLNTNEIATIYVRIEEVLHDNPEVDFEFITQSEYISRVDRKRTWDTIFLGVVLIMMLYSFMVFTGSGVYANLYYALYLFNLGLVFVFITGILREEIISESPEYTRFGMLAVPSAAAFYYLFISKFLDTKAILPRWDEWIQVLVKVNLLFIPLGLVLILTTGMFISGRIMQGLIMVNCMIALVLLVRVLLLRNPDTLFYAIGTTCFLITVFIDSIFWDVDDTDAASVRIGLIGEVLFYSVGLGLRLRKAQKEREDSQLKLIEQLEINQELSVSKAAELEKMVEKRTEKLTALNSELKVYDQMISHDLKGPISNIRALTDLLLRDKDIKGDVRDRVLMIKDQSNRSTNLIRAILDFSVTDELSLEDVVIDLNGIFTEVFNSLNKQILDNRVQVTIGKMPTINKGVRVKVYQLFYNLVNNAIKYRRDGVEHDINVSCVEGKKSYVISIQDNGLGFDKKETDKIFEPNYRSERNEMADGEGMGLAICKRIAVFHGWEMTAESELGKGSRFDVEIPKV